VRRFTLTLTLSLRERELLTRLMQVPPLSESLID
jgi:hypothetical protein